MLIKKVVFAHCALTALCAPAFAQEERTMPRISVYDDVASAQPESRSATRTDTALIDVPQAVSVISDEVIKDQGMRSMADVARYVPGLSMGQGEGHRDAPTLRGNASTADFFVDGVRDDLQYFRDLYNAERIEVLKGPNAMIFGRGGGGGVINRVIAQADWTQHRSITLQGGSFDYRRAAVDLGQGVNDALALRLNAVYEDSDSYRDFLHVERYGVNPTATLLLSPATSLRFGYEHLDDQRTVDRGVPSRAGRPLEIDEAAFFGNPDLSSGEVTVDLAKVTFDHRFSDVLRLRNHVAYADYGKYYQNVHANSAVNAAGNVSLQAYTSGTDRKNLFNQTDVIWDLATGSVGHALLFGIEFGKQQTDNTRNPNNNAAGTVNIAIPTTFAPVVFTLPLLADNQVDVDVVAAYLQDQITLGNHWQLVAGLRFDQFDLDFDDQRPGSVDLRRKDDFLSPRIGVVYKPIPSVAVYSSYSVSYLPQSGDQFGALTATTSTLEPEEFENLELGAKWSFTSGLGLTAAVYELERSKTAVVDPATNLTVLTGSQKSKGVELELTGTLTESWDVLAGYAYQDAKITSTTAAAPAGRHVPLVPDHQASLWNSYRFSPMWRAALGVVYQSDVFASLSNAVTLPSFVRVDAALFVTINRNFAVQLNVENALDKTYWGTAHNDNNITPGSPLAGRLTLTATF